VIRSGALMVTHSPDDAETLDYDREAAKESRAYVLHVIGDSMVATRDLPTEGHVVIGRSDQADVPIKDPSISRRHLILHLGPPLRLEDLGSSNGVRVGGRKLAAREIVEIAAGEMLDLGAVVLIVQKRPLGGTKEEEPATSIESALAAAQRATLAESKAASPRMRRVFAIAARVAEGTISVLLLGETGVGKEVLAEALHQGSPRAGKPFVRIHCGALSEGLLESELFGHEKGAFTGAFQAKQGLLEAAHGGTVFLDEVGEMPLALQVKLLRVLEDKQVSRVGAVKSRLVDIRFIAATNRDLEEESAAGRFRPDLYYRLSGVTLFIPPLRERREEIEPLAKTFLREAAKKNRKGPAKISEEALAHLRAHAFPGNVRELRNVIERAALVCEGETIEITHLWAGKPPTPARVSTNPSARESPSPSPLAPDLKGEMDAFEKQRIQDALEKCAGNQSEAARLLGLSRGTFVARVAKYGLPRPRKKR